MATQLPQPQRTIGASNSFPATSAGNAGTFPQSQRHGTAPATSGVPKRTPDECWPWLASATPRGYGQLYFWSDGRKRSVYATRVSWCLASGRPWPNGKFALHSCDNPICVNPRHIRPGTQAENVAEAIARGRWSTTKLNPEIVRKIRVLCAQGLFAREVAEIVGVARATVSDVKTGRRWSHVA